MTSALAFEVVHGMTLWSRERRYGFGDEGPLGGVVVETIEDDEGRAYRVLDPFRTKPILRFHILRESEVDTGNVEEPGSHRLKLLVQRLAVEVAFQAPGKPRKVFTAEHAQLVVWMHRLVGAMR